MIGAEDGMNAWAARHVVLLDLLAAAALAGATIIPEMSKGGTSAWWLLPGGACFTALAWRRRRPVPAAAVIAVLALALVAGGALAGAACAAMWVAVYSVAAREPRSRALAAAAALEVLGVVAVVTLAPASVIAAGVVLTTGTAAAAVGLGIGQQTRRAYLAALEERATRLEHEWEQQARLASATERTRIAREVHDIVTHSLSVMVTLADAAAATSASSPDRAGQAMRQVAATGRQAIGEMRRTVMALRTDADEDNRYPLPALADLDDLLAEVRVAGLPVRLTVQGQARSLPQGIQLAAYRIVQEALTNVRKHAIGATGASVTLRYDAGGIDVEIGDDGHTSGGGGTGHGITGMRERAVAYGGSIAAGPRPGGGWLVRARIAEETHDSDHDPDRR
jgi:signal transduction histidine kinase